MNDQIQAVENKASYWKSFKPILKAKDGSYIPLPMEFRLWSRVDLGPNCWNWNGYKTVHNYGLIKSRLKGQKPIYILVHRLSWTLNHGQIPKGLFVCHKCDNPLCVRPDHLFLGTGKDNMQDCVKKGRMYFQIHPRKSVFASPGFQNKFKRLGEKASNSKLAEQQVLEIRKLWKPGMMNSLAKQFNIGCTAILSIVKRKTWKHI